MDKRSNRMLAGLIIALAAALLFEYFGLWWAMPIAGLLGGLLARGGGRGFLAGGLGAALAWGIYLVIFAFTRPVGPLLTVFAGILDLGAGLAWVPVLLALLIAFLMGGLGGLTGAWLRQVARPG